MILDARKVSVGEMGQLPGEPIAFPLIQGEVYPFIPREETNCAIPEDFMIPLPEGCPRYTPLYHRALARSRA